MTTLTIPEMSCGHCKAVIEKTVLGIDPAARLEFDLPAHKVDVQSSADPARITRALTEAGYAPAAG